MKEFEVEVEQIRLLVHIEAESLEEAQKEVAEKFSGILEVWCDNAIKKSGYDVPEGYWPDDAQA
jgi:hypothetical protein